jgi:hypothetical protein
MKPIIRHKPGIAESLSAPKVSWQKGLSSLKKWPSGSLVCQVHVWPMVCLPLH